MRIVMVLAAAGAAMSSGTADAKEKGAVLTLGTEHVSYSRGGGSKRLLSATARVPFGRHAVVAVTLASGERSLAKERHRASGIGIGLQQGVGRGLVSRTSLSGGRTGPLFARLSAGEEIAWKTGAAELRAGARVAHRWRGIGAFAARRPGTKARAGADRL